MIRGWISIVQTCGLILLTNILLAHPGPGQYPLDFFQAPVEGALLLSGTFGELRGDHFHSGVDIKGFRGRKIVAAGKGHIALIRVSAGGYGNVLYVQHPNGFTSVYAHLNRFPKAIADLVQKTQLKEEKFELEIKPDSTQFPLNQGDYLGEMGNTGYSFGPHLHFEIRETLSGKPVNPLLFGINVADQQAPMISQLRVYGLNEKSLTDYQETFATQLVRKGQYRISKDTLFIQSSKLGVAVKSFDKLDGARNWNGVYQIRMQVDGKERYAFEVEKFDFGEWRYLNAHVDYADVVENNSYYNRCFRLPGNQFSGIQTDAQNGVIPLESNKAKRVIVEVSDVAGNVSSIAFWVKRDQTTQEQKLNFDYYLPYQQQNQINNYYLKLKFPEGSFYQDLPLEYHFEQADGPETFSTIHAIHHTKTPIHKPFTLQIRPSLIPHSLKEKAYIALCTEDNQVINCGGSWKDDFLETKVRRFGDFSIRIDTVPPAIQAEDFRYDLRGRKRINFKAKDNLGTSGTARGLKYRASINGKWVLLTYDLKYNRFTYTFPADALKGEQFFRLEITDDRNNTAVFEEKFIR